MFKICFSICTLLVIVSGHAVTLFDTVLVIAAQVIINVVANLSQQLLIITHSTVFFHQANQVVGTMTCHSPVGSGTALSLAIHRSSKLLERFFKHVIL